MKMTGKNYLAILLIVAGCLSMSCHPQIKFEKDKWADHSDDGFPNKLRPQMLKDLTTNNKLVGLSCSQLITKIGTPNYQDDSLLVYDIDLDYGSDIDPVYSKKLKFIYSKDSVIRSFKVVEWGNK